MSRQWQDQDAFQDMQEQEEAYAISLEEERLERVLEALERIKKAGAKPDDVELLAKELGVSQFIKQENEHALGR